MDKKNFLLLLPRIRATARLYGYAVGLHGSLARDYDLIAVAWTKEAKHPDEVAEAIKEAAGCVRWRIYRGNAPGGEDIKKPHGRLVYCFDWDKNNRENRDYIDLSVIPPSQYL